MHGGVYVALKLRRQEFPLSIQGKSYLRSRNKIQTLDIQQIMKEDYPMIRTK